MKKGGAIKWIINYLMNLIIYSQNVRLTLKKMKKGLRN